MQQLSFCCSKKQRAFTLIELLVVLAISAIILSIAAPSFANMVSSNRVAAAANELVVALNLAKSEAVKTGQTTVLCQSSTGTQCSGDQTAWAEGWIIFNDSDGDGVLDGNEQLIRVHEAVSSQFAFRLGEGRNTSLVKFRPDGKLNAQGTFCFRNASNTANGRKVIFTRSGRIRTESWNSNNTCRAGS